MTRRTALRGAAWTAPAITIAVAAPNIAAASGPALELPSIGYSTVGVAKRSAQDQNNQYVIWDFDVTLGAAVTNLNVTFTGISAVIGLDVTSGGVAWTGSGTSTRSWNQPLAKNQQLSIRAYFTRSSNGKDKSVSASFATGSPSVNLAGPTCAITG